jgi:hypothetical protein
MFFPLPPPNNNNNNNNNLDASSDKVLTLTLVGLSTMTISPAKDAK